MSDAINLIQRVSSVDTAQQFTNYSKVRIIIDNDNVVEAGNDSGRTLEFQNPFGTQSMANAILAKLTGFQYQPFSFTGALLDPAAEMGDAISAAGVYGGMYQRERKFGRLMKADLSAPHDEEINHEYEFVSAQERRYNRQVGELRASLVIQSNQIEAEVTRATEAEGTLASRITQTESDITAKVSSTGGNDSSFSWSLTVGGFTLKSGGSTVMNANANGLSVTGTLSATSGQIGGFTISASSLYNGMTSIGDTTHNGVYVGTDGIACGAGKFKVTSSGAVTASNLSITGGSISIGSNFSVNSSGTVTAKNMNLSGTLTIGGSTITAGQLRSGALSAYNNGSTWSTGAGYGYNYNYATQSGTGTYPSNFTAGYIWARTYVSTPTLSVSNNASVGSLSVGGSTLGRATYTVYMSGGYRDINVWTW